MNHKLQIYPLRIAFELLLDYSRKTCSCIDENVQRFAGGCRASPIQRKTIARKRKAIISDAVGGCQVLVGLAGSMAGLWDTATSDLLFLPLTTIVSVRKHTDA